MDMPKMPEIIQTGLPSQVDDPAVLQFVMQAVANAQLVRLRKLEESKVPIGTLSFTRTISDNPFDIDLDDLELPWISFSVINTGPGGVHVEVTSSEAALNRSAFIPAGGTKNIDFGFAVITMVMFAAAPGTTATITVAAVKGKG